MAKNQFKDPSSSKKTKKTNSKKKVSRGNNPFKKISSFFSSLKDNEKLTKSTGLFLLVTAAFLLFAFASFLFTWQVDQNIIANHWNNPEIQVENWLGKIGAYVSHQFIFNGFGVSSFIFVYLIFLIGFKILFKVSLLPIGKSFKYSIFSILWISITLSYILPSSPILGGALGYQTNIWLASTIGGIGILLFLGLSLLIFLVLNFNISFNIFQSKETVGEENEEISKVEISNEINNEFPEIEPLPETTPEA